MKQTGPDRWVEVSPSQFPHEAEGLALVRGLLPDVTPYRAWSNFEFRDSNGRWHEVDLLLLGQGSLHLIELKYYAGSLRGNDHTWLRDGKRPEDSPLKLARRKAQYFASKLRDELRAWAAENRTTIPDEKTIVPFVQESVFLHHPHFQSLLAPACTINLYGPVDAEDHTNLPPITDLILEPARRRPIGPNQERILTVLMQRIGLVQRRERSAGSWVIEEGAIDSGDGWQDWLAFHQVAQQDRARIRFLVAPQGAPEQERKDLKLVAEHEFRIMSRLQHDGLLRPRDLVESELGIGLVYPYDETWERLDLWFAAQERGVPLGTQLSIIRQLGETLQYAHNNKVVHRQLSPHAVWIRRVPDSQDEVKARLGGWQSSGTVDGSASTHSRPTGVTRFLEVDEAVPTTGPAQIDGSGQALGSGEDSFKAPEGVWNPDADRIRLDVFGMGALAFFLLTGTQPAANIAALKARLREQQGLDVAIELPQVGSALRSLILRATNPSPTLRTPDISTFLNLLSTAESELVNDGVVNEDPLDARPHTILDGRFRLERRLGQGSTAAGLLVTDLQAQRPDAQRVLKIALHDAAASRLADEAQVLRGVKSPRIVRLIEGPIVVSGRQALLLESAGTETLTEVLRSRARLSLDLLERYGTDLLDCLVVLDKAGIDHRDIKPSNLGVRESRGDRTKHLVLFDFSLTRAAASATSAGTPPYLDPFLTGKRTHFDSAAERYAAAVVLFEMATGLTPVYGDGQADPASVNDEATIETTMFDPTLAQDLVSFFRTALARDAVVRHDTATAMQSAWRAIFAGDATTQPDESYDEFASRANLDTHLSESGLTARALSALEPYAVGTVSDLLTVDPVRLTRMQGVANVTRLQITARIKEWRERLGTPSGAPPRDGRMPTPRGAAEILIAAVASTRSTSRAATIRLILGFGTDLDAFATHAQLGAHLHEPVTPARVTQLLAGTQKTWAEDEVVRSLLDRMADAVSNRLHDLGSIATPAELDDAVLESLAPDPDGDDRLVRGLLRLALERRRAINRADGSQATIWTRRREGTVILLAQDQSLFEVAESFGREADALVSPAGEPTHAIVPATTVRPRLERLLPEGDSVPTELRDPNRLARLAAAVSKTTAASAAGQLHHRDLSQVAALRSAFEGFGGTQHLSPDEIRDRVRVRFPALARLPKRPTLDALVQDAGLGLIFDDALRVYRAWSPTSGTTGINSRQPTNVSTGNSPFGDAGAIGARLDASVASRSFMALGVSTKDRPDRLTRFLSIATTRYDAHMVDITGVLLDALREESAKAGLPWDLVRAADAEGESSRGRRGLAKLVSLSWGVVEAAVTAALDNDGPGPVLLIEASPLARYDNVGMLATWSDLGASRSRAVWLVVPQLGANHGAMLDGRPVPIAAPSQFLALDNRWIDDAFTASAAPSKENSL